jgi:hypothetical protein
MLNAAEKLGDRKKTQATTTAKNVSTQPNAAHGREFLSFVSIATRWQAAPHEWFITK